MRLDKKQKIAVIFSFVFFAVWIVTMAMLAAKERGGNTNNAIFTTIVGCMAVIVFYVLIFADKTKVSAKLNDADALKIKSCIISAYISVLYVLIAGFFMMSVASLFTAFDFKQVRKFNWVGATVLLTMIMLAASVITSYLMVRGVERRLSVQEHNDSMSGSDDSSQGKAEND